MGRSSQIPRRPDSTKTRAGLAAQFADDVKNPLAAIKGAAQFLREEQQRRGAPSVEADFVALILRELERLERAVDAHEGALRAPREGAPEER